MQFRYTILYVEEVAATAAFYAQAFGIPAAMIDETGGDYAELATGATKLAFAAKRLMRDLGKTPGEADPRRPVFEIAFETRDVAAAVARAVAAGATLVQEPAEMPWGQTIAYVADMNGFLIEICTPVVAQG